MKKLLTGILTAGLALSLGILGVSAASGANYRDDNNDGICDYKENSTIVCVNDKDQDGICDYREPVSASCINDRDGDGLCDYREDGERPLDGSGSHHRGQNSGLAGGEQENTGRGGGMQHRRGR